MVHPSLMQGDNWIRCCICGALHEHPYPNLTLEITGFRTDVCKGECARSAGAIPAPKDWWDNPAKGTKQ